MNKTKKSEEQVQRTYDLILEFLDLITNQILFQRQVYPPSIFKLKSCYINLPVYQVQDANVKAYIHDGLASLRGLICDESCQLDRFEIVILDGQETALETFSLGLNDLKRMHETNPDYRQLQRDFRGVVLQLNAKMADLKPLPSDDEMSFTFRTKVKCKNEIRNMNWHHISDKSLFGSLDDPPTSVIPIARFDTVFKFDAHIEVPQ